MQERAIEEYLRDKVKTAGGRAYKFVSPGNTGVPDRMILLPGGKIIFAELKAPGKKPSPVQKLQHEKIRKLGFEVLIIDNKTAVDDMISRI